MFFLFFGVFFCFLMFYLFVFVCVLLYLLFLFSFPLVLSFFFRFVFRSCLHFIVWFCVAFCLVPFLLGKLVSLVAAFYPWVCGLLKSLGALVLWFARFILRFFCLLSQFP